MKEKTYFLNMFSDYDPPETLKDTLSQAVIVAADLDAAARRISIQLQNENYISDKLLDTAAADICQLYGLTPPLISL